MSEPTGLTVRSVRDDDGIAVQDVTVDVPDGPAEAWLIEPVGAAGPGGPAILWCHWFDTEAPNGNRDQFVEEATGLARAGVTSLLPQLLFPWSVDPGDAATDGARIEAEVDRLGRLLDRLAAWPGVDPGRLAVVGHDFGAMHAAILVARSERVRAFVAVAPTPRWGDWFLPFWPIADDRIEYLRALRPLDPIEVASRLAPASVLYQFARHDFYIAPMSGRELQRATSEPRELVAYDAEHDLAVPDAIVDRRAFLARQLDLPR